MMKRPLSNAPAVLVDSTQVSDELEIMTTNPENTPPSLDDSTAGTSLPAAPAQPEESGLSPAQRHLRDVWEEHMKCEFATKSVDDTMATMIAGGHVNHVPTMTGGRGLAEIRDFYSRHFIPHMPPDTKTTPVSRTIGDTQIVDEMIFEFTHSITMDWMLPGVPPTGKKVTVALVAIIGFREGKVSHEHIYWDQASVLVQLGLLDPSLLPVAGAESAAKVSDPGLPSNALIHRAEGK
jgi:carboxymethylenebutenolidase